MSVGENVARQVAENLNANYSESIKQAFDETNQNILNKIDGKNWKVAHAAGFAAEEFHAGSFNINAAFKDAKGVKAWVVDDGFNTLGQTDVAVGVNGSIVERAQLKYLNTPYNSGKAVSETLFERYMRFRSKSDDDISFVQYLQQNGVGSDKSFDDLLYSGQLLLVPDNQVNDVKEFLRRRALEYQARGDATHAKSMFEALDNVTSEVSYEGITSATLSKSEAEELVNRVRRGETPLQALRVLARNHQAELFKKALKTGITASAINMALEMGPELVKQFSAILDGQGLNLDSLAETSGSTALNGADTLFLQTVTGYVTANAKLGSLGEELAKLEANSAAVSVAILTIYDSMKLSAKLAAGKLTKEEYFAKMMKMFVVNGVTAAMSTIPVVGFFIGSIVGTVIAEQAGKFAIGLAIENGYTYFGLVTQDYKLPKESLKSLGVSLIEIDTFEYDRFVPDKFEFDRVEFDQVANQKLEFRYLRRGVIGVNKTGYI